MNQKQLLQLLRARSLVKVRAKCDREVAKECERFVLTEAIAQDTERRDCEVTVSARGLLLSITVSFPLLRGRSHLIQS
jgi:hypothetical protein